METFDYKTYRERYMTNNEIDDANIERLVQRLEQINTTISNFEFKMSIYGDDYLSASEKAKYEKLIDQKEWIENKLKHS